MARKTKKRLLSALLQSSGMAAAAIVLLVVSFGAGVVPGIFADTINPSVSGVRATPGGGANYGVKVTWDGSTRDHWKGEVYRGSTLVSRWTSNDKQQSITGLTCGVRHTFTVAAAGPGGGAQSNWGSDTATPPCPTVQWVNYSTVGNKVNMSWRDASGFSESYTVYVSINGGAYTATTTTATSYSISGACNTQYQAQLTASANGQTGPATGIGSVTTDPCPPGSSGGSSSGGSGSSGSGSTGGGTTTTTSGGGSAALSVKRAPITNGIAKTIVPATPGNFSADVVSNKVVVLSWDAAANADHYLIRRSTDDTNWREIANTTQTSFKDEGANFSTTYYYQLQAIGADGQKSATVKAQATTEAFKSTTNTITSQDKLVVAKIPEGAIEGDYSCTLSTADDEGSERPKGQSTLLGPYDLLCVTEEGDVVGSFEKPVQLTMKLASVISGYKNLTAQVLKDNKWRAVKVSYDQQKQQIDFTMASSTSFAAFGQKQRSVVGTIMTIFFILLLIAGTIAGLIWWRRRPPMKRAELSAEREFNQALAQPDCSHLHMAQQVIPSSNGCYECEQQHTQWNALRICLLCGHVGCSDDSPQQHAFKHYQETGHPLIYEYGNPNGDTIGWCYIDQTYI